MREAKTASMTFEYAAARGPSSPRVGGRPVVVHKLPGRSQCNAGGRGQVSAREDWATDLVGNMLLRQGLADRPESVFSDRLLATLNKMELAADGTCLRVLGPVHIWTRHARAYGKLAAKKWRGQHIICENGLSASGAMSPRNCGCEQWCAAG